MLYEWVVGKQDQKKDGDSLITENRKARFRYQVLETLEAGIVLEGWEVKSLREGGVNLSDSYAVVNGDQVFLLNLHISPYAKARMIPGIETRSRKLLLHRKEINSLIGQVKEKGRTLIPLKMYWNKDGRAKVLVGICIGKQAHDKRQDIKKREDDRFLKRVQKQYR